MALTAPLKLYKRKATGSGTDKFDEICLDASNFKVTWEDQTATIPNQLDRLQKKILSLDGNDADYIGFGGYVVVWDDGDVSPDARPNNAINSHWDCDLYLYGTGLAVEDGNSGDRLKYSFPDHSGTFAMTKDIGLTLLDLRGFNI